MTKLRFIFTSTIIVATALALAYTAEVIETYHRELKAEIEAERERLAGVEREKAGLLSENIELRRTLQNRTSTLSRGGRPGGFETLPVTQPSGLDAAFFEDAFASTDLAGIGGALVDAETATGISALVLAGIVALETGWGSSRLARDKNNLAGLGAFDGREYSAGIAFGSREESILFLARLLRDRPGTLTEIGEWYASDPAWVGKVAGCMALIGGAKE